MDSFVHITSPTHAAIHEDVFIPTETLLHDPEPWLESLGFIISLEQGGGLGTACGLRSNEWDQWWDIGVWGPAMRHAEESQRGDPRDSNEWENVPMPRKKRLRDLLEMD